MIRFILQTNRNGHTEHLTVDEASPVLEARLREKATVVGAEIVPSPSTGLETDCSECCSPSGPRPAENSDTIQKVKEKIRELKDDRSRLDQIIVVQDLKIEKLAKEKQVALDAFSSCLSLVIKHHEAGFVAKPGSLCSVCTAHDVPVGQLSETLWELSKGLDRPEPDGVKAMYEAGSSPAPDLSVFRSELKTLVERHLASIDYTTHDDGVHVVVNGCDVNIGWPEHGNTDGIVEALKSLQGTKGHEDTKGVNAGFVCSRCDEVSDKQMFHTSGGDTKAVCQECWQILEMQYRESVGDLPATSGVWEHLGRLRHLIGEAPATSTKLELEGLVRRCRVLLDKILPESEQA